MSLPTQSSSGPADVQATGRPTSLQLRGTLLEDEELVPSGTPPTLQFLVSGFSPSLGAGGMGHAPVTSLWSMGGHRAEGDLSRLGAVHPLVAISGCVGGTSFSWGVSPSPPPRRSPPGRGRERERESVLGRGCEAVEAADLPPSGPSSPWGICEGGR